MVEPSCALGKAQIAKTSSNGCHCANGGIWNFPAISRVTKYMQCMDHWRIPLPVLQDIYHYIYIYKHFWIKSHSLTQKVYAWNITGLEPRNTLSVNSISLPAIRDVSPIYNNTKNTCGDIKCWPVFEAPQNYYHLEQLCSAIFCPTHTSAEVAINYKLIRGKHFNF